MRGTVVTDTFTRTVAAGWGSPDTGPGSWTMFGAGGSVVTSDVAVNGSAGTHSVPATGAYRATYLGSFSVAYADVAVTGSVGVLPAGAGLELANLMVRGTSLTSYYLCRVTIETTAALTALIFDPNGNQLGKVTVPGITYTAGLQIRVRAQVVGKTLRMKVWAASGSEPVAWTLSVTDSTYTGAGWIGVRSGVANGNTNTLPVVFTYDNFSSVQMPDFPKDPLPFTVLAAFGADLSKDPSTWPWKDITADVRYVTQVPVVVQGRADDTSQASPATCTLELNNFSKAYSAYNPFGPNWPNVKRNTPIWVIVDPHTRFFGYADGWPPSWDITGKVPIVKLTASGILRRLTQGKTPVQSPMRHAIVAAQPAAYYPMEDAAGSTAIASGLPGGAALYTAPGTVSYAAESTLPGSLPVVTLTASSNFAALVSGTFHGHWQVDYYIKVPSIPANQESVYVKIYAQSDTIYVWDFVLGNDAGGNYLAMHGYTGYGAPTTDSGHFTVPAFMLGQWNHWRFMVQQSGSNLNWQMVWFPIYGSGSFISGTATNSFIGAGPTGLQVPASPALAGVSLGHLAVFDAYNFSATDAAARGYGPDPVGGAPGELATDRFTRICAEAGIPLQIIGTSTTRMGPQPIDTPVNVLRDVETAEMGLLVDGFGPGLTYITRAARQNQAAALTLDAAQQQVAPPFAPADDDQRNRNFWRVDRKSGSSATYQDSTGPLGTDPLLGIGTYDSQVTINVDSDGSLLNNAAWRTHLGTASGFRYPKMAFDLTAVPALIDSWPGSRLLSRLDVLNPDVAAGHLPGPISLLDEGYTETFTPFRWKVDANTSQYRPWEVFQVGDSRLGRVDTAGSTLATGVDAVTTTLTVNTTKGPRWITTAEKSSVFPFDVTVDGVRVTVTNITGTTNTQTFTVTRSVDGQDRALPAGGVVKLWRPGAVAL